MADKDECGACWLDLDGSRHYVTCYDTGECDENGCERDGRCPFCGREDKAKS